MNCINHYTGLGEVPVTQEAVILPLTADVPGTWAFMSSFNGAYQYVQFTCNASQSIVVPIKLNENYSYTFRLYKPNGSILNDTYYTMHTVPMIDGCVDAGANEHIDVNVGRKQFVASGGQTDVTYLDLINAEQIVVFIEGAILQEGADTYEYVFDRATGTVTFNTPLQQGQNVTMIYFK